MDSIRLRAVAALATLLTAGVILSWLLDAPSTIANSLLLAAAVAVVLILQHGFSLIRRIAGSDVGLNRYLGPAHIIAHAVPLSYVVAKAMGYVTPAHTLIYLLLFLLFFYSGRRLWKMLFTRFGKKMYAFFTFGNTGMMTGLTMLGLVGALWPEAVGPAPFNSVLLAYLASHFLLTGPAIAQIDSDWRNEAKHVPTPK